MRTYDTRLCPLVLSIGIAISLSACGGRDTASVQSVTEPCIEQRDISADMLVNLVGEPIALEDVETFFAARMQEMSVPGATVAIINQREIAYSRTFGVESIDSGAPVTSCSIFQGASITKPLFGYFVMTFVDSGELDLDRPLNEYLPFQAIAHDERYLTMTARHVLAHQTGLPNWGTDYPDRDLFLSFPPGEGFSYSGEAYQYLARVLQHISGTDHQGLEALFQSRVAEPIGLANTQIVPDEMLAARLVSPHEDGNLIDPDPVDARSKFGAAFGVHTNATDMANWLVYLMNDTGLDPSTLDAFLAPQGTNVPTVDGNPLVLDTDYALGFSTIDTPLGRLHVHDGNNRGYSSALIMHREAGWGIAVLSNENQSSALAMDLTMRLHQSLLQQ